MTKIPREIIILFDGTNAKPGTNTNIERIKKNILRTDNNYVIYRRGVNILTASSIIQTLSPTETIRDVVTVYDEISNLELNSSDNIHIFGYSRGAISARALAQCIAHPEIYASFIKDGGNAADTPPPQKIKTLGVFDPVYGRLNIFAGAPKSEDSVSRSENIDCYIEVVAKNEHRNLFSLRSSVGAFHKMSKDYGASPFSFNTNYSFGNFFNEHRKYYKTATNGVQVKEKFLALRPSRKFISLNGGHADIGNQHGDASIGIQSLLIMLNIAFENSNNLEKCFDSSYLNQVRKTLGAINDINPNSGLSFFEKHFRSVRNLGLEYRRRRKITANENFVHHDIYNEYQKLL